MSYNNKRRRQQLTQWLTVDTAAASTLSHSHVVIDSYTSVRQSDDVDEKMLLKISKQRSFDCCTSAASITITSTTAGANRQMSIQLCSDHRDDDFVIERT